MGKEKEGGVSICVTVQSHACSDLLPCVQEKKKKAATLQTRDVDFEPFGFKLNEIIRTPLGVAGTVIGVKYDVDPPNETKETGRVWVRYENGSEAPLEPKLGAGYMTALGYRKCSEADHIRRDVGIKLEETKKLQEEKKLVDTIIALKAQGLPIPDELLAQLPKEKPAKTAKGKDGKDGKKKK